MGVVAADVSWVSRCQCLGAQTCRFCCWECAQSGEPRPLCPRSAQGSAAPRACPVAPGLGRADFQRRRCCRGGDAGAWVWRALPLLPGTRCFPFGGHQDDALWTCCPSVPLTPSSGRALPCRVANMCIRPTGCGGSTHGWTVCSSGRCSPCAGKGVPSGGATLASALPPGPAASWAAVLPQGPRDRQRLRGSPAPVSLVCSVLRGSVVISCFQTAS